MSLTRSIVFEGKEYWGRPNASTPPDGLPDVSREGNDGTFNGTTAWTQLPSGIWVLELDGDSDFIGAATLRNLNGADFSQECWVNFNVLARGGGNANRQQLMYTGTGGDSGMLYQSQSDNKIHAAYYDGVGFNGINTASDVLVNTWYHVIQVVDSVNNIHSLYLNGDQVATVGTAAAVVNGNAGLYLGRAGDGDEQYLNGKLGKPILYLFALSEGQAQDRYFSKKRQFGL